MNLDRDLEKIHHALLIAQRCASAYTPGSIEVKRKTGGDPVTEADLVLTEYNIKGCPAGRRRRLVIGRNR